MKRYESAIFVNEVAFLKTLKDIREGKQKLSCTKITFDRNQKDISNMYYHLLRSEILKDMRQSNV